MKKITLVLCLALGFAFAHSQNFQISFAGSGASSTVESVMVENLSQCSKVILSGGDILLLSATADIEVAQINNEKALSVYPNPYGEFCNIELEVPVSGNTTIEIYSMDGKKIIGTQIDLKQGKYRFQISGIGSGVSFIQVKGVSYSYSGKILSNYTGTITPKIICQNQTTTSITPKNQKNNAAETINNGKDAKGFVYMQYSNGDRLKITGTSGIFQTVFMLVPTQDQTVTFNFVDCTDGDGNHYPVVQIGTQIWMAENLKTSKYRDGTSISTAPDNGTWQTLYDGAYCNYNNTFNNDTIDMYGSFYNWFAIASTNNIAPAGWHVPTDAEWTILTNFLGGDSVSGGKLKENCPTHWSIPDSATNETGFSALPVGRRSPTSYPSPFVDFGTAGLWWSSTDYCNHTSAWARYMYFTNSHVYRNAFDLLNGFSVRCVKD